MSLRQLILSSCCQVPLEAQASRVPEETLEIPVPWETEESGVLPEGMGSQGTRDQKDVREKMVLMERRGLLVSRDFLVYGANLAA